MQLLVLRHRVLPLRAVWQPGYRRRLLSFGSPYRRGLDSSPSPLRRLSSLANTSSIDTDHHVLSDTPAVSIAPVSVQQQVDYTTLNASIAELQKWIPSRVEQIVQWHQQCLAVKLQNAQSLMTWMYISWHPIYARVGCGNQPRRGAASEGYTFGEALHKTLRGLVITQASLPLPFERVVQLNFSESIDSEKKHSLWCEVMGRHSNVIMTNAMDEIRVCARQIGYKTSSQRQLQIGKQYTSPPTQRGIPPTAPQSAADLRNTIKRVAEDEEFKNRTLTSILVRCFQGVSPGLAHDLLILSDISPEATFSQFTSQQSEALFIHWLQWISLLDSGDIRPTLDRETGRYSLLRLPGEEIQSVHTLLDTYYPGMEKHEGPSKLGHTIRSTLKKNISRLEGRRKKLKESMEDSKKADSIQRTGDLIISNLHKCLPGSASLTVEDWESGDEVVIKLDPLKSAVDCAQGYFKRAKKLKRAKSTVGPLLEQLDEEISYLREVEEAVVELESSEEEDDRIALGEIREELIQGKYMTAPSDHHLAIKAEQKAKKKKTKADRDPDGLRVFSSPNGFRILIGRNSRQNDILSKTRGKPGDLWFHARGVPGSHVLMKLDGKTDRPDSEDIECAAALAAYYSKSRNGSKVPVAMTNAKNVTKPKRAKPGLVQITNERTIQVRPSDSLAWNTDGN